MSLFRTRAREEFKDFVICVSLVVWYIFLAGAIRAAMLPGPNDLDRYENESRNKNTHIPIIRIRVKVRRHTKFSV